MNRKSWWIRRRLAVLTGYASHERPKGADERAASASLNYSKTTKRECRATAVEPPANFLRAYLSGAYDPPEDPNER